MTNQQVAEAFANGRIKGKSLHMFIDDNIVYSYGRHFPICRRTAREYYFTTRGYSQTTTRHKNLVLSAISLKNRVSINPKPIIFTDDVTKTSQKIDTNVIDL